MSKRQRPMSNNQRNRYNNQANKKAKVEPQSELQRQFYEYSVILDANNERKERIYKSSRDVTAESKKLVFLLLRITPNTRDTVLQEAYDMIHTIATEYIRPIASEIYVNFDEYYYRYVYSFSFGLQEFIEGVSLYKYLKDDSLISKEEVEKEFLVFENLELANGTVVEKVSFPITIADYILGIADLTGEQMRYATNAQSTGDRAIPFQVKQFLQQFLAQFLGLEHYQFKCQSVRKDLGNKISVMKNSTYKVEQLCFRLTLQDKEQIFKAIDFSSLMDDQSTGDDMNDY
jgi:predicted translin family RNA/ssDNA-binding protein